MPSIREDYLALFNDLMKRAPGLMSAVQSEGIVAGFIDRTIDQVLSDDQKQLLCGVVRYMVPPTVAKLAMGIDDPTGLLRGEDPTDLARADATLLDRLVISGQVHFGTTIPTGIASSRA